MTKAEAASHGTRVDSGYEPRHDSYCGAAEFTTVSCRRWRIPDDITLRDDLLQKESWPLKKQEKTHALF